MNEPPAQRLVAGREDLDGETLALSRGQLGENEMG
jgi:hypothetical protein